MSEKTPQEFKQEAWEYVTCIVEDMAVGEMASRLIDFMTDELMSEWYDDPDCAEAIIQSYFKTLP
jgi:hypothetical protein